ncbi:MAG: hypothetical protein AMXMBFR82_36520 [Candidatus Hydrogenedentota bacterium]
MIRSWRIGVLAGLAMGSALASVAEPAAVDDIADALADGLRVTERDPAAAEALESFLNETDTSAESLGATLFQENVQPVFAEHCYSCHGPDKQKGGLRLDVPTAIEVGGAHGAVVMPGDPENSRLVEAIRYANPDLQMPPKAPLPDDAVAAIEQWIASGAPWPGADDAMAAAEARVREEVETSERFWAFRPVVRPEVPGASKAEWISNPIDAFVLARLTEQGLAPSDQADRRTLIRRVYLDVLGLPPPPEEVDAFVADPDPGAYERLVDQVLASPHYGERWARHWLDVVRFAETTGFETNLPRRNAWHYRDYVIEALNADKSYTEFVREQIVGDAFGATRATGFLVGGPDDKVKSPDIVLTRNQRDGELHDMVSTIGGAFLGLTVGCAKCHDHKFDPISQRDYYRMRAMIAGVKHGEQELPDPNREKRLAKVDEAQSELRAIESELLKFVPMARVDAGEPARPPVSSLGNVERFEPVEARFVRFTVLGTSDAEPCIDELEIYTAGEEPVNVALASAGATATASSEFVNNAKHKTIHLNDGKYGNDFSWIPKEHQDAWAQIELPDTFTIDRIAWARDRNGSFKDRLAIAYRIEVAIEPGQWRIVATSEDRAKYKPGVEVPAHYYASKPEDAKELESLLAKKEQLQKKINRLSAVPMVYAGQFEEPEPTRILQRGDPMSEGDVVVPGTPKLVGASCDLPADSPEQERRRALADWIASPDNPFTARVIVNRIWQHHFGRGIVDTPSDFGAMGARPSHPELLDWLSSELIAQDWRLKSMHRMILLSSTYRQSAVPRSDALAVDADSRYLWRFPPRRLEAEPLRDSILAVSGALNRTMGGPGYDVFEPDDSYVHIYVPKEEFAPGDLRRMIYQWKPRVEQDITFGVFDCPDATQATPKRVSSTSPLQALSLLNSPFMNAQAEVFAGRLKNEAGETIEDQVRRAFLLAFGREPDSEETAASAAFVRDRGLILFCRALYSANEFLYLN